MANAPIPVAILTGFLGAGKTTLLARLLRWPALRDTAVLINEFGEVGLDHLLVEPLQGEVALLRGGCVCCSIRGDLKAALIDLHDRRRLDSLGNRLWHSDSSYKKIPARYSALCAHVIPPSGGETEFADMRMAWDLLDDAMKEKIKGLVAEHSRIFSKGTLGFQFTEKELHDFAPVRQPLVRTHPRTGRHSLFLSSHAGRIVGWPQPEALMLLRELTEHATQREFVYRHVWRVGDVVMWDNSVTMHRAQPYDDLKYPRDMRRSTVTCGAPALAYTEDLPDLATAA